MKLNISPLIQKLFNENYIVRHRSQFKFQKLYLFIKFSIKYGIIDTNIIHYKKGD